MSANAGSGSEKRRKISEEDTDRISNLPKPVLHHILSLLPTEDAVATSLLSRSWKCHWRNIHNLYFTDVIDRPCRNKVKHKKFKFAHFVNRVLILLNQQTIDKAVFKIEECGMQYDLSSWITGVMARKLKVLEISLSTYADYYPQNRLPSCIFTCNMLEVFVLRGYGDLRIPSVVCLPNLKTLRLERVRCQSNESFHKLICGCSSLETLYIDGFRDLKIPTVVSLPNLKSLHLKNVRYQSNESFHRLIYACSLLVNLDIEYFPSLKIPTVVPLPNLKTLHLHDVSYQSNEFFETLISGCSSLETLYIRRFRDFKIPTVVSLSNLKTLHIYIGSNHNNESEIDESVQTLISRCSSLETLDIYSNVVISTICSPTLRNLTYTINYSREDLGSKLEIKAPGLKYLNLSNWFPRGVSSDNLHSLSEAIIRTDCCADGEIDRCSEAVLGFFEGVCNVKDLKLCYKTMKVLDNAGASLRLLSLNRLTVEAECCSLNWRLKLVEQSNQLEFLEIDLVGKHETSYAMKISTCSSISLKRLVIANFKGREDELEVIAFFLRNAEFLTKVMLEPAYNLDVANRSRLLQKVSEFPQISTSCQITFS